jgi:hypothetical protein
VFRGLTTGRDERFAQIAFVAAVALFRWRG